MAAKIGCRPMGSFCAELLRGETVWRLAAPAFMQFILSLRAAILLASFEIGLAPDLTPPDEA